MADYPESRRYGGPRRSRSVHTHLQPLDRDDAEYLEETTFIERGKGPLPRELIPSSMSRRESSDDVRISSSSRRPRAYDDYGQTPVRHERSRGDRSSFGYEYSDDSSPSSSAAGASRTYRGRQSRHSRGVSVYSEDESRFAQDFEDERSRSPVHERQRKKSGVEGALESLGLGGLAGTLLGKSAETRSRGRSRSRSRSRSANGSRGRYQSGARGDKKRREWAQAAQAALIAGAVEAFRARNEPGAWTGAKAKRIATAAVASGGIDKLVDRDPDHKSKLHLVEAVIGGLAANRLANGPTSSLQNQGRGRQRSRSQSIFSRYRSKSRRANSQGSGTSPKGRVSTGDKLKDAGAGVVLVGVGKQIFDRFRSRSKARRSPSTETEKRDVETGSARYNADSSGQYSRMQPVPNDVRQAGERGRAISPEPSARLKRTDSSSDSLSSTDMENRRKKMRGKEFLTAGLATIATIHAAHGVYSSMEASDKRHKLVAEGEMTPEVARKKRSKAWLQDAAAVGIAALGIKGAYSEWKEMNEQRHSVKELEERRRARQKRREKRLRDASLHAGGGSAERMNEPFTQASRSRR